MTYEEIKKRHAELGAERVKLHEAINVAKVSLQKAEARKRVVIEERKDLQREMEALAKEAVEEGTGWICPCGHLNKGTDQRCVDCGVYEFDNTLARRLKRVPKAQRRI